MVGRPANQEPIGRYLIELGPIPSTQPQFTSESTGYLLDRKLIESTPRTAGGARVLGDSGHPDRGWEGEFLDYAEDYDPWKVAVDAMCDHWSEWDGMTEVVATAR